LFLGLRLVDGVSLASLDSRFLGEIGDALAEVEAAGLLVRDGDRVRLTDAGRMASNEVFGRLLLVSV
jgi:coproporphyrinogen III oxidase-like Fe-S oxidoreductase